MVHIAFEDTRFQNIITVDVPDDHKYLSFSTLSNLSNLNNNIVVDESFAVGSYFIEVFISSEEGASCKEMFKITVTPNMNDMRMTRVSFAKKLRLKLRHK